MIVVNIGFKNIGNMFEEFIFVCMIILVVDLFEVIDIYE